MVHIDTPQYKYLYIDKSMLFKEVSKDGRTISIQEKTGEYRML